MLGRPKRSKIEAVAPKEEEEVFHLDISFIYFSGSTRSTSVFFAVFIIEVDRVGDKGSWDTPMGDVQTL
jgi:hypothetical protein